MIVLLYNALWSTSLPAAHGLLNISTGDILSTVDPQVVTLLLTPLRLIDEWFVSLLLIVDITLIGGLDTAGGNACWKSK